MASSGLPLGTFRCADRPTTACSEQRCAPLVMPASGGCWMEERGNGTPAID
jgi:hypothetical protein